MEIYKRGHVTVDDTFARFGSKSYALNKINSVDVRLDERTSVLWLIVAGFGAISLLTAIGTFQKGDIGTGVIGLGVAVAAVAAAIWMFRQRSSRTYHLILATSSGEVQATHSPDETAISELRGAIEERMARAG